MRGVCTYIGCGARLARDNTTDRCAVHPRRLPVQPLPKKRHDNVDYEAVAKVYREATREGKAVLRVIQNRFGCTYNQAGTWVWRARKKGLLPPVAGQGSWGPRSLLIGVADIAHAVVLDYRERGDGRVSPPLIERLERAVQTEAAS